MWPASRQSWTRGGLLVLGLGIAIAALGCGSSDNASRSDREAITAVFDQLRQVQDSGDAEAACREVYVIKEPGRAEPPGGGEADTEGQAAPRADGEAGAAGGPESRGACEAAFRKAVARKRREVSDLTTEVRSIELEGDRATAIVHTELRRADGSPLSQDVPYDLVRTADGWRVRISEEG